MSIIRTATEVIPESVQRAAGLFFSRLLPSTAILLVGIFFSRVINSTDYGLYTTLWVHLSVASVLAAWGFPSLILSHGSRFTTSQLRSLRLTAQLLSPALSIVAGLIFFFVLNYSFLVVGLSVILLIIQTAFMGLESDCVRNRKEWMLNVVNGVWAVAFLSLHVFVVWLGYDLVLLLSGWALVSGTRLLVLALLSRRNEVASIVKSPVEGIASVWFGFGLNDAVQILSRWMDKVVAAALLLPAEFAIYFNGTFEIPVISMLMTSVAAVVTSRMGENLQTSADDPFRIFRITTRATSGVVFPVFFLAFWHREWLITTLFSDAYLASAALFGIYIWVLPVRIGSFSSLLQVQGKSRQLVAGALLDLGISLTLMVFLYPVMGVGGLALALVSATWIQAGYYVVSAARASGTNPFSLLETRTLLVRFVLTGVFTGLPLLISSEMISLVVSLVLGGFLVFLFIKTDLMAVREKKI